MDTDQKEGGAPDNDTGSNDSERDSPVTDQEVADQVQKMKADLAKHPEIPLAVRQKFVQQAPTVVRQALTLQHAQAASVGAATASDLKEMSYSWDTTEVPDGTYQIRVVASDKVSNPQDALTAKSLSTPFLVANTTPTLSLSAPAIGLGKTVTVTGIVKSHLTFVKAVQGKVDGGDPVAAVADDGLFDSPSERFSFTTPTLTAGAHKIEIQTVDQAGNMATSAVTVRVP